MCQRDNNTTIEQTTYEGHQLVFRTARDSSTRRSPSAGPITNMLLGQWYNGRHTKLRIIYNKLKLKIIRDYQKPEAPALGQAQKCGFI